MVSPVSLHEPVASDILVSASTEPVSVSPLESVSSFVRSVPENSLCSSTDPTLEPAPPSGSHSSGSHSPGALPLRELAEIARRWSPRLGTHAGTGQPPDRRWYCRLEWNPSYEVWLLGWNQEQSTEFHDHGGSSGAVHVVAGTLVESRPDRLGRCPVVRRTVTTGETIAFGPRAIHDVVAQVGGSAMSVHVYSPPLTTMTYYNVVEGRPFARATVPVEGPEPDADDLTIAV